MSAQTTHFNNNSCDVACLSFTLPCDQTTVRTVRFLREVMQLPSDRARVLHFTRYSGDIFQARLVSFIIAYTWIFFRIIYTNKTRIWLTAASQLAVRVDVQWRNRWSPQEAAAEEEPPRSIYRSSALRTALKLKKAKFFHEYSLPRVGPGADPGVQAVSPQVTWSESRHKTRR